MTTELENELICEKLLGWTRPPDTCRHLGDWLHPEKGAVLTPTFLVGADAWMLLEVLQKSAPAAVMRLVHELFCYRLTPAAVRAAALDVVRASSSTPAAP